ncbi:MAG: hypothetical protein GC185_01265 [Alphaproteobacteria bacterium]|nr:hypothetical protein [Alphaproteobacteria bacterium]
MQKTLTGFLRKTLTPLISLQLLVMTVSGIVLAWQGSIMYVMPFILALVMAPLVYPLLLWPAGVFANIMNVTSAALPRFSSFMLGVTVCYILALFTATAILTFYWISPAMQGDMFYVALVFGAVAAAAPWAAFALKDRQNVFFTALVLFLQIGLAVMAVAGGIVLKWPLQAPMWNNAFLLFGVMVALVVLQGWHEKRHPEEKSALFGAQEQARAEGEARLAAERAQEEKDKAAGKKTDKSAPFVPLDEL